MISEAGEPLPFAPPRPVRDWFVSWYFAHRPKLNSWLASALIHSVLLLVLALATLAVDWHETPLWLTSGFERDESLIERLVTSEVDPTLHDQQAVVELSPTEVSLDRPEITLPSEEQQASLPHRARGVGFSGQAPGDLLAVAANVGLAVAGHQPATVEDTGR